MHCSWIPVKSYNTYSEKRNEFSMCCRSRQTRKHTDTSNGKIIKYHIIILASLAQNPIRPYRFLFAGKDGGTPCHRVDFQTLAWDTWKCKQKKENREQQTGLHSSPANTWSWLWCTARHRIKHRCFKPILVFRLARETSSWPRHFSNEQPFCPLRTITTAWIESWPNWIAQRNGYLKTWSTSNLTFD